MELVQIIPKILPIIGIIVLGGCILGGIKTEDDHDAGIKRNQ
jgi:hypothetical protein